LTLSQDKIETTNTSEIEVFPNPTSGFLFMKHLPNNILSITIINTLGEIVNKYENNIELTNNTLDVSKLRAGIYYVKFSTTNSQFMKKIAVR
jgi:hypothetical protein